MRGAGRSLFAPARIAAPTPPAAYRPTPKPVLVACVGAAAVAAAVVVVVGAVDAVSAVAGAAITGVAGARAPMNEES